MVEKTLSYESQEVNLQMADSILKSQVSPSFYSNSEHQVNNNIRIFEIGNCYPKMIWDHDKEIAVYRFINIHPIGIMEIERLNSEKIKIKYPSVDELEKKFQENMGVLRQKSEVALLKTIHDYLIKVPFVQMSMNKFFRISIKIYEKGYVDVSDTFGYTDVNKTMRYIKFLRDFGFVEIKDNKIYPGVEFKAIMNLDLTGSEFYEKLLASILKKSFSSIKQYLNITQIDPYLRLSNSYYLSSFQVDKRLKFDSEDFKRSYYECYRIKKPVDTIENQLGYLTKTKIFERKNGRWTGTKNIFDKFKNNFSAAHPSISDY